MAALGKEIRYFATVLLLGIDVVKRVRGLTPIEQHDSRQKCGERCGLLPSSHEIHDVGANGRHEQQKTRQRRANSLWACEELNLGPHAYQLSSTCGIAFHRVTK